MCAGPTVTRAQISTEGPASIVVFPKVIAAGTRDTFIQISNVTNSTVYAQCWYVNGALLFPDLPPGPGNPPLWVTFDFTLTLTHNQPTNWVVSRGRPVDPLDPGCRANPDKFDCYGAGTDPGLVPAVVDGFEGALLCIQTDASGAPFSGNALIGEVTLNDGASVDVSKYSGIGFTGFDTNNGDNTLVLGAEYSGCPQTWILDHRTDGMEVAGVSGSQLRTDLTVMPCSNNFDTEIAETVTLQLSVIDEMEQAYSASTIVTCWATISLSALNPVFMAVGTPTAQTRLRPSLTSGGFLIVAEEFRSTSGPDPVTASAAVNAYVEGVRASPDLIITVSP